jgi:photosystem II stability/assembly factor-like uncharacterized protein
VTWQSAGRGLEQLTVQTISTVFEPNGSSTILATTTAAAFRLDRTKDSWTTIPGSTLQTGIRAIASMHTTGNDIMLLGTAVKGILRTTDAGQTWLQANTGLSSTEVRSIVAIHVASGATELYAASQGIGVSRFDAPDSVWTSSGEQSALLYTQAMMETRTAAGTSLLMAGTTAGIFYTSDRGSSWNRLSPNPISRAVNAFTKGRTSSDSTFVLAATAGGGMYRSWDGGMNWAAVNNGLADRTIYSTVIGRRPSSGSVAFAATNSGLFRSFDMGDTERGRE